METLYTAKPVFARGNPAATAWKEWLKGKIVFVGGEFAQGFDRYPTAVGEQYGVRIHAEALASELAGKTIRVSSRWVVIPSEIAAIFILFFLQRRITKPAARFWIILLGMLSFSVVLSYVAFDTWRGLLNFAPLLAAIFLDVVKDLAAERISTA